MWPSFFNFLNLHTVVKQVIIVLQLEGIASGN